MNTLEQMTERFSLLPSDFQEAIRTFDYDKKMQQVINTFHLHIDQLVELEKTMAEVIFGELRTLNLAHTISEKLRLPADKGVEIAIELNRTVLGPLKEHIKQVQNKNDELENPKKPEDVSTLREVL